MLYFYITSVILTFLFMIAFKQHIKELEPDDLILAVSFVVMVAGFSYAVWACIFLYYAIGPIGKLLRKYYIGE